MNQTTFNEIFKNGSKTFYNSSILFPADVREDVTILYAFVRTADNFVDSIPQNDTGFLEFRREYENALNSETESTNEIVREFVALSKRKKLPPEWTTSFLDTMEQDLTPKIYETMNDSIQYMYGSAECIGLLIAKILDLPEESYESAQLLGRAFQYINFLRDIKEDFSLGRNYFPREILRQYQLQDFTERTIQSNPEAFKLFVRAQLATYKKWQEEAENGFKYIPKKYLIPIKTASDLYEWTAMQIEKDPMIVLEKKVKPSKIWIFIMAFANILM